MKTTSYNPSQLERQFALALQAVVPELEKHLSGFKIQQVTPDIAQDNPVVVFDVTDRDGDPHELVVRLIQKPDKF